MAGSEAADVDVDGKPMREQLASYNRNGGRPD
jgi:hypothetical protein